MKPMTNSEMMQAVATLAAKAAVRGKDTSIYETIMARISAAGK
jgi:hypothetical protein